MAKLFSDFTFRGMPVKVMDKLRVLLALGRSNGTAKYRTLQEITIAAIERGAKVIAEEMAEVKRGK